MLRSKIKQEHNINIKTASELMRYRPEIDGLRALAVIAVILFHTQNPSFKNGFIGVDIFFVISGFLISGLIISKRGAAEFSLSDFYLRRARRLLPALLLMMIVCMPFAWNWMYAYQQKDFSQSLIAANLFSSNILYWLESQRYFANSAALKPLLHTWSLAVEEQFYIVYPLFLLAVIRFGGSVTVIAVTAITIASAVYSEFWLYRQPLAQYYFPQARVWLFGVGALLFLIVNRWPILFPRFSGLLSSMGVLLLVLPIMLAPNGEVIEKSIGVLSWTSICVIGAALIIIFANQQNRVGRLLSLRPLVGIGMISYGLYLWHYPIFTFARIRLFEVSITLYIVLIALSCLLAYFSWRFIEVPIRNKNVISNRLFLLTMFGLTLFIISIALYSLNDHQNQPLVNNGNTSDLLVLDIGLSANCSVIKQDGSCRTDDQPEVMLWGDSFAVHLLSAITASKPDVKLIQLTKSACNPIFDKYRVNVQRRVSQKAQACAEFNQSALSLIKSSPSLKYVVISGRFSSYFNHYNVVKDLDESEREESGDQLLAIFDQLLSQIQDLGVTPVIVAEPISPPEKKVFCAAHSIKFSDIKDCAFLESSRSVAQYKINKVLQRLEERYNVISLDRFICQNQVCRTLTDDVAIYSQGGHLSKSGSALIGRKISLYSSIVGD